MFRASAAALLIFLAGCGVIRHSGSNTAAPKRATGPVASTVLRVIEEARRASDAEDVLLASRLLDPSAVVITPAGDTIRGRAAAEAMLVASRGSIDVRGFAASSGRFEQCVDGVYQYEASLTVHEAGAERRIRDVTFAARWTGTDEAPQIAWLRLGGSRADRRPSDAGCVMVSDVSYAQHRRELVLVHTVPVNTDGSAFFAMAPRSAMKRSLATHGWNRPFPDVGYTFPLRARAALPSLLVRQFVGGHGVMEAQAMLSSVPGDVRAFNLDSLSGIEMSYRILGAGVQGGVRGKYAALTLGPQLYRETWRIRESRFWQDPDDPGRQLWNGYASDTSRTEYFVALGVRGALYHRMVQRFFVEAWGQYMIGPSRDFPGTSTFQLTTSASRSTRTMGLGMGYAF